MRGIDAYATLGAPGLAEGIDYLGTRFAPKIESISAKSFGRRSMERAANEGFNVPGMRWGNNAARSINTGTTYTYNATTHPYDIMIDRAMYIAPYETAFTDMSL